MRWAVLDTSVYIGHWERGLYAESLAVLRKAFIIRHSAVVLSELRRGARTRDAQRLVQTLYRLAAVQWEPTPKDWWDAGNLIRRIGDSQRWDKSRRRGFQNDVLIALTARHYGAAIVTANARDFALLARELEISVVPV